MKMMFLLAMLSPLSSFALDFDSGVQIPAQFAVNKERWTIQRVSDSSHVTGGSIEEMLELVTRTCVIDTCRADNAKRQMIVLAQVPESSWNLTADEIGEILEHSDAGVYDQDVNGVHVTWCGHHVATGAGPHRFVLRSIPASVWSRLDQEGIEEIVENLTRQADRLAAISLWMDAHRSEP